MFVALELARIHENPCVIEVQSEARQIVVGATPAHFELKLVRLLMNLVKVDAVMRILNNFIFRELEVRYR